MQAKASSNEGIRLTTLTQLAARGGWQLELAHERPRSLFLWITRGQGIALFDGQRRGIGAHNAVFVPAGTLMALDLGRQGFGHALEMLPLPELNLPGQVVHLRIREAAAQSELNGLLDAIMREQTAARPMVQTALAAHAALVVVWLHRQIERTGPEITVQTPALRIVRAFSARLTAPGSEEIALESHAAALGVTPAHLARVCKSETGRTAAGLIAERRLHRARSLLTETDLPIRDVARLLGFASAAYFTRFVQSHCGLAPSALRRTAAPAPPPAANMSVSRRTRVAFGPGSAESDD